MSVKLASLKERKKEGGFLTTSGPVGRLPFWKVPLCIPEGSISHADNDSEA